MQIYFSNEQTVKSVKWAGENSIEKYILQKMTKNPDTAYQNCVLHSVNLCNYVYIRLDSSIDDSQCFNAFQWEIQLNLALTKNYFTFDYLGWVFQCARQAMCWCVFQLTFFYFSRIRSLWPSSQLECVDFGRKIYVHPFQIALHDLIFLFFVCNACQFFSRILCFIIYTWPIVFVGTQSHLIVRILYFFG